MGESLWRRAIARLLLMCELLSAFACAPAASGPPIAWETDHDSALRQAKASGRPVIVHFGAAWCGACQRLEDEVWPDPSVRGAAARFVAVHVDLTDDNAAANTHTKRYGVESLPTVVFIDSHGELLDKPRLRTYLSPRGMKKLLQTIP